MKLPLLFLAALVVTITHTSTAGAQTPLLQLCLAEAADFSPVYPTQVFPANAREIAAVAHLAPGESHKVLTATWIAVDVGKAAPPNKEIAKSNIPLNKMTKVAFRLSLLGAMPVGKYRLDVLADGNPWKSAEFTVMETIKTPDVKQPADLLPLRQGQVWTYSYVQEAGPGAKISLPDVTPDADGKLRFAVTLTVAGADAAGSRVDLRRNNALVFQEWWRLDSSGLASTQRKAVDPQAKDALEDLTQNPLIKLDPPQMLLRWPLRAPQVWTYTPTDHSYSQTIHMWGPLPMKSPAGNSPGYLVLIEQKESLGALTAERQWMPGIGLVREVIISTVGNRLAGRTEMVLQKY
jgi:hypothetical protein